MKASVAMGIAAMVGALALGGCADESRDAGCEWKGHHHVLGEIFPDECNTCMCKVEGVQCSLVACPPQPDGNPASCSADWACPEGPSCNGYCCGQGEHCVNDVCLCGTGAACGPGERCAGVGPSGGACGSTCCGNGNPCPL